MINWINQKLNINLDPNGLESIKDFSLIWNIFERLVGVCRPEKSLHLC